MVMSPVLSPTTDLFNDLMYAVACTSGVLSSDRAKIFIVCCAYTLHAAKSNMHKQSLIFMVSEVAAKLSNIVLSESDGHMKHVTVLCFYNAVCKML